MYGQSGSCFRQSRGGGISVVSSSGGSLSREERHSDFSASHLTRQLDVDNIDSVVTSTIREGRGS
ncbi:hypothetical protein FHX42_001417 [Saccharopolyspora lacisalsi]|uniref:Uncharacterized protein n=1 Tax=Halosaccharopolyspora lacisalsi TaxID=1000566 RepID=A0A839DZB3_9PSEU|nr:hypothetical protein [Halosaccharopolyspora lacisalsi]